MTGSCVRGCVMARRHLDECDTDACRGCLPRRAESGLLCWPCHRRMQLLLTDAPDVYAWLEVNIAGGQARIRQDWERRAGDTSVRAEALMDQRYELSDRIAAMVEWTCETFDLTGPGQMTMKPMCDFLLAWLTKIETVDRWITHWWNELAEITSDCHALAPWRPEMRRCTGIDCPECHTQNLVIFGGESDVSCLVCRIIIPPERYGIWVRMLAEANGIEDAS